MFNPIHYITKNNFWDDIQVFQRNEFIHQSNDTNTNLYYIEEGSLKIFIYQEEEEKIIRFGYRGNIITALDSFLSEEPSIFYIQVLKKTKVKIIRKNTLFSLSEKEPKIRDFWQNSLHEIILQQTEREIDLLTNSPKERYLRVLKRSPQLFQEIPNKYIASYLRMSPETLSRLKKH